MLKFPKFTTEKWLRIAIFFGLLVLVVVVFSQKINFTAVDLGRHLENGKVVWSDSQVLFKNLYSYTEPDTPFINHHWLVGVIYYAVYLVGGFNLLSIFNVLLALITFILAFKMAKKKTNFYVVALLSVPSIFLMSERVEIRPEIFSYLFIILTWFILERADERKNYRMLYWLFPLFLFWVNIHSYFFLGLALVGFKAAEKFLPAFIEKVGNFKERFKSAIIASRVWLVSLGAIILTCLLNPNFIKGFLYPFNIFKEYGYEVAESKSIFYLKHLTTNNNYNFPLFEMLLAFLIFSFAVRFFFSKKIKLSEIFIGVLFSVLALFAVRNLSIFSLVALVLISANLAYPLDFLNKKISTIKYSIKNDLKEKIKLYVSVALILLIAGGAIYLVFDAKDAGHFIKNSLGWNLSQGSEDSINFFKDNKLSGPIFNNYDLGSALDFWLYPTEKVFVDNRPEAFTNNFFSEVYRPMQLDYGKWREYDEKYQFKVIYFSYTDSTPWAQTFLNQTIDQDWNLVYFDRYTVIFLNNKRNDVGMLNKLSLDEQAIRTRLRSLAADSDLHNKFNLASLATLLHQTDIAEEIYRSILFANPDNGFALWSFGSLYSSGQDREILQRSVYYFQRAVNSGLRSTSIYNQMALVNWKLGYYALAEENWKSALKINKKDASALYYLEQIRQLRLQRQIE